MPKSMPSRSHFGFLHRLADCLPLRMHITLRDVHIAVTSEIGKRPRVHVWCPPCQARVTESIKLERHNSCILVQGLILERCRPFRNRFGVLLLQARRLNVPRSWSVRGKSIQCQSLYQINFQIPASTFPVWPCGSYNLELNFGVYASLPGNSTTDGTAWLPLLIQKGDIPCK